MSDKKLNSVLSGVAREYFVAGELYKNIKTLARLALVLSMQFVNDILVECEKIYE